MSEHQLFHNPLARIIAEDIAISEMPGAVIQKWRRIFRVSQCEVAKNMGVKSSVISDYESGRRSPGVEMVRKIMNAFLAVDRRAGNRISEKFADIYSRDSLEDSIVEVRELAHPPTIKALSYKMRGDVIASDEDMEKRLYGYVILDSLRAILELTPGDFVKLYGLTAGRAIVFTGVSSGKSALIALKAANLHPGAVVFQGLKELDELAERIAKVEEIPLIVSNLSSADELLCALKNIG